MDEHRVLFVTACVCRYKPKKVVAIFKSKFTYLEFIWYQMNRDFNILKLQLSRPKNAYLDFFILIANVWESRQSESLSFITYVFYQNLNLRHFQLLNYE